MGIKVGNPNRLEVLQEDLTSQATNAIKAGNFELACRIMRTSHGVFQSSTAADRSKDLRDILEKMEQNTAATVDSYTGTGAKVIAGAKILGGAAQVGGGVLAASVLFGFSAGGVVSTGVSQGGQGFNAAVGAVESTVQGGRERLNGKKAMLQNEQEELKGRRDSAKGIKNKLLEEENEIRRNRQQTFSKMGG